MSEQPPRPPIRIDPYRVVTQLLALRNQAIAAVRGIELLLEDLGMLEQQDAIDGLRAPNRPPQDDDGVCRHPKGSRIPAPVMGKPHRFFCNVCQEVVSDE